MLEDGKPNLTGNADLEKTVEFVKELNDKGA